MLPFTRGRRSGLHAALSEAREVYRQRSTEPEPRPTPEPSPQRSVAAVRQAVQRLARGRPRLRRNEPDVYLDVPRLHVDRLGLKVDELDARVALEARVLNLLQLNVGVDAGLRGVALDIEGVDVQALLKVRLENLTAIVDRVMRTIDDNPQLLESLVDRLGATVDELGINAARAVRGDVPPLPGHERAG
jgi:hypothetical protein